MTGGELFEEGYAEGLKDAERIPPGWKIERKKDGPFKRIHLRAPNGYTAVVDSMARNPENILYMLAEALLDAHGVSLDRQQPFSQEGIDDPEKGKTRV